MVLPDGAPGWAADPAQIWQRAEDAERRGDAQVARLVEVSIPRDVPAEQRLDFARAVAAPWVADGMAAQIDIHCTRAEDGGEQPHAHIILTMRRLEGDAFAAKKERAWNNDFRADDGRAMRGAIADTMNRWLAERGIGARVDHRTHEAQGITGTAPESDVPKRAWKAHAADPTSEAAAPVRDVLADRRQRQERRRDIEWEQARAAYAAAATQHYATEKARRTATYAERRAVEQAARADLRARQRGERDRTYRHTRRGIVRSLSLAFQRGAHNCQIAVLDVARQAAKMTVAAPTGPFPGFDEWCEERAAEGDQVAKAALDQRTRRRAWLAQKDPAAAAKRTLDDVIRAADRTLRGSPHASVDDQTLFVAARNRLTERRDQGAEAAWAARAMAEAHRHSAGFWRRLTDSDWQAEYARLNGAAQSARQGAERLAARYDTDVRTAREAARLAAAENRCVLAAWLARPDVRAARAARDTADRVRGALDAGDQDTIQATARGDLAAAAQAAQAADERGAAEERRRLEQRQAEQVTVRLATAGRRAEAAQHARQSVPPRPQAPPITGTAPAPGLKPR